MNNKPTGLSIAPLLVSVLLALGLSGCGSTPEPVAQQAPPPVSEPAEPAQPLPAPEPEPMTSQEEAPEQVASGGVIKPDYPERYVVVKGDTLWDIAKRFLNDPWLWPEMWHINPSIRNPHLIYPGDVIVMYIVDGKPHITLDGEGGIAPERTASGGVIPAPTGLKVVKLSPKIRTSGINKAINTIPASAIDPFLNRPRVVTEDELEAAPYIVSSYEGHLISGTGNRIYARKIKDATIGSYNIVRKGDAYIDPETDDVLGYEAIYLGSANLLKVGDPSTLTVINSVREILNDDILVPYTQEEKMFHYVPRSPESDVKGQIISVFNGVSQIGRYNVVVLNRGARDGLAPGHVLAVYQKGETVSDQRKIIFTSVDLPDERAGLLMVFRSFDKVSYALVMEANRAMHVLDRFEKP